MDESTLGSLRHRVPILDGEYFHEWTNEMLVIFNKYHLKHKSKEFIINTPFVTFWRVVSPRLARRHLGASDKIVELNQGVCKGKEIAYFVKIYR